ncbi:MAG: glycosyltransferase [Anaerolineae bacterium]|nr:glycosyltransferase [Anaerolineae bacterium]
MRILFLTPQLPYPPHQGTALRNFGLVRGVAEAGHDVWLLAFQEPGQPDPADTPLADLCARVQTVPAPPPRGKRTRLCDLALSGAADMARRLDSAAFAGALAEVLSGAPFDVIHVEGIEMAAYMPALRQAQPKAAVIYDAHNAEHDLQRRVYQIDRADPKRWIGAAYSFVQWRRLQRFERAACRQATHVLAVSEADAAALRRLESTAAITVIPNGIDVAAYAQPPAHPVDLGPAALVFSGKMDYRPNVDAVLWFADRILPRVRAQVPEAQFVAVGQKPHPRLARLRGAPGVTLTGWVPQVEPYLHAAAVYVVPLRMGSGTRFKALQAMAAGCALVSTTLGAEGIDATPGRELLLADTADAFAEAVAGLLRRPDRRADLGRAAQALVRRAYDWRAILPRLLDLYPTLTDTPP